MPPASSSRSSLYHKPKGESEGNWALMRRLDELFMAYPFYGSRQMVRHLRREGVHVGRHRARRMIGCQPGLGTRLLEDGLGLGVIESLAHQDVGDLVGGAFNVVGHAFSLYQTENKDEGWGRQSDAMAWLKTPSSEVWAFLRAAAMGLEIPLRDTAWNVEPQEREVHHQLSGTSGWTSE